jgi:hypothetical protein
VLSFLFSAIFPAGISSTFAMSRNSFYDIFFIQYDMSASLVSTLTNSKKL